MNLLPELLAESFPNSSRYELLKLVSPLLLSNFLGIGIHKPLVVLVQSFNTDVWDLGHHCPQLNVARSQVFIDEHCQVIEGNVAGFMLSMNLKGSEDAGIEPRDRFREKVTCYNLPKKVPADHRRGAMAVCSVLPGQ